jgi:hypothetical protein
VGTAFSALVRPHYVTDIHRKAANSNVITVEYQGHIFFPVKGSVNFFFSIDINGILAKLPSFSPSKVQ